MAMLLSQRSAQTERKRMLLLTGKLGAAETSSSLQLMQSQRSLTILCNLVQDLMMCARAGRSG